MTRIIILCSILILLYWPVDSRICNECSCNYNWDTLTGSCSSLTFLASCVSVNVTNRYCTIASYYTGNSEVRQLTTVPRDTFQDSHFFQVVEEITLSGTTWLETEITSFIYGCDWDNCNDNDLVEHFPDSFKMNINHTILNDQLLSESTSALTCESCTGCIQNISASVCASQSCPNASCFIDEIHNYILTPTNNCTYTFYSLCLSYVGSVQTPHVRIRATYYIDFPEEKRLEIDEVDITCKKDKCNSIETVEYLKGQIQTAIYVDPDFKPLRPNDTTTTVGSTTTTTIGSTTTTTIGSTTESTSAKGSQPARACFIVLLNLVLFIFLF